MSGWVGGFLCVSHHVILAFVKEGAISIHDVTIFGTMRRRLMTDDDWRCMVVITRTTLSEAESGFCSGSKLHNDGCSEIA
jgi:hypothetical protein